MNGGRMQSELCVLRARGEVGFTSKKFIFDIWQVRTYISLANSWRSMNGITRAPCRTSSVGSAPLRPVEFPL